MTETLGGFSLGIGLAGLAGFRAFVPLIIISLVAHFSRVEFFRTPFQVLGSTWILLILLSFLAVEIFSAKFPNNNYFKDYTEITVKVLSGGVIFAAVFSGLGLIWGFILGALLAGLGNIVKVLLKPVLMSNIEGMNQQLLSSVDDMIAFIGTVLVMLIPAVSILVVSYIIYLAFKKFRQQKKDKKRVRVLR